MHSKFTGIALSFLIILTLPAWSQNSRIDFDVSASINWVRGELNTQISYDLAQAGIRLPAGRFMAEETLRTAYPQFMRSLLLPVRIDSSSTISDLINRRELGIEDLNTIAMGAAKIPPNLSPDLTRMNGRYTVFIERISSLLLRHRRPTEPERLLMPIPAANYTGIIIIADQQLPVHGRRGSAFVEPCLFPRIWDTNMNVIFDRSMLDPARMAGNMMVRYAAAESIFRPTPSGLEGDLAAFAGPNPMRIIARQVFGLYTTDPIIDRHDAMRILANENNRRLLREGRVVFVLNEARLMQTIR